MSVIATFEVSADSFPLGKSIENQSTAEIEIERVVPMRQGQFPFIFVWNHTDFEEFERSVSGLPEIESVVLLESFDNGRLYKIMWSDGDCPVIAEIISNEGTLLSAIGDPTEWVFEIRFPEHTNVSDFFRDVTDADDVELSLKSLVKEIDFESVDGGILTDKQEQTLKTAFEMGYFCVPREAHLDDVADRLGISPSAASSLVRRGCAQLFEHKFA
ncbi:helix-turn-helix domain-containing protein [Halohasta litorea]|uniref:Helix-turn-helix domain-containing protein n=1 Tax=Halohasta litorea TaxID=869891 RepID=A0ABD6D5E0_9EURY|nr:helix-turn-helix domain-containing protein [Halohasta litorea]